jgi:NADH dehydrogenase/NADH:ubiquinone oxidoreductase subunit G
MIKLVIDGKSVEVSEGTTILAAARKLGIEIPAVCAHAGLDTFSACRLCTVEIRKKGWTDDYSKMVASCAFPVENDMKVFTASEGVIKIRKTLLDLMMARCPDSEVVKKWALEYGIKETSFEDRKPADKCILCGTCTRVCEKVGSCAISTNQRGATKRVGAPFGEATDCIGCLSCALNCPTGHIKYTDDGNVRKIWNKTFEMKKCTECGKAHITVAQVAYYVKLHSLPEEHFLICDDCKQAKIADVFASISS